MFDIISLIGRQNEFFLTDIAERDVEIRDKIKNSSFLIIGGAGSIGQATVKEIFKRDPKKLYVVDLSENNLAELVRDLRSSIGYIKGDFRTFAIDAGSAEFEMFFQAEGSFDYILNLSALKHVRSERDPYTLMRMIQVNICNIADNLEYAGSGGLKKYFSVSTDKAANPENLMGATKRIMELLLYSRSDVIQVSTARFANVAFSDGSLLHGFNQRLMKEQPIAAPNDVKRYFITPEESGRLCMLSALLGENRDVFFPKFQESFHLIDFQTIAEEYLRQQGYEPYICQDEEEARRKVAELRGTGKWPCFFSPSNTTGEKAFEEFFTSNENVVTDRFHEIGVVVNEQAERAAINIFLEKMGSLKSELSWNKKELVNQIRKLVTELVHDEKNFFLDGKM